MRIAPPSLPPHHSSPESPLDPLGGAHSAGPWQRTGGVGEGGPAHPDDTQRSASTEMEDWKSLVAGRPLTSNDVYPQ